MGISCSMSIIAHPGQKRIEILRQFERRRVIGRKICLSWNFEVKSALWIYGRPYNIPGVEPLENKLLWTSADIMPSSFSFLKKLVTLATILRVYFFCDLLLWIHVQDFFSFVYSYCNTHCMLQISIGITILIIFREIRI